MNLIPLLASVWNSPLVLSALAATPAIYLGMLALGRWMKRSQLVPLGASFHLLCISLAAYTPLKAIHVTEHPGGHADRSTWLWHDWAIFHFEMVIALLGVLVLLTLIKRYYWQNWFKHRHQVEAPKFLQQIFGFVVFVAACVMIAGWGYKKEVDAFLTGSGIVAVVIGFAMQETLANIVSGIAVQISKPFKPGDWLILETTNSTVRAEVVELNWRSTKLRTNDDVYLDIPNKTITAGTITNLSFPTKTHANRIRVGFERETPPNIVRAVLHRATVSVPGVLEHPPVKVFLRDFADCSMVYEIKYSLDDESRFNDIENAIRTNIWYEARRAGLTIPFPIRTLKIERRRRPDGTNEEKAAALLRNQEMLAPLNDAQRERLISRFNSQRFGNGEYIIHQGTDGSSMFIIIEGEADVIVEAYGQELHVTTLRAGEAFGEMSLLTGEPRTANVIARTDCEVWELPRSAMQPLIQEDKVLIERMSELLTKRKLQTDGIIASNAPSEIAEDQHLEIKSTFVKKLSELFKI